MSLGLWLFLGIYFVAGGLIWYLYRRSKKDTDKKRNYPANDTETADPADAGAEELLFTGLMLSDIDNDADSSNDKGSDGFDGGGFDGGDSGDGGGFDF
ncbi:hypothetical protein F4Z99_11320 [Candidatus Poribacteria bacterium]|nr:hypothetical protein [Candidatus Poribacteria bacterium]MYA98935.1 hypothetical protein [Candidatus Poribacteria bacterium]